MNCETKTYIVGIISALSFGGLGTMAGAHYGFVGMFVGLILGTIACISILIASHMMISASMEKEDQKGAQALSKSPKT